MLPCVHEYNISVGWDKVFKKKDLNSSFAAVQVRFDPQKYNVTEGDVVNITLVTNTSDYMFNFTVTLEHMNESAVGESCSMACIILILSVTHFLFDRRQCNGDCSF